MWLGSKKDIEILRVLGVVFFILNLSWKFFASVIMEDGKMKLAAFFALVGFLSWLFGREIGKGKTNTIKKE
jgi:hypothetical protein